MFTFIAREFEPNQADLVGDLFVEALSLGVADLLCYEADYELPEHEWPHWFEGKASYNGDARAQTPEQIDWLRANVGNNFCAYALTVGAEGPYFSFGVDDASSVYLETSVGHEAMVQALPSYKRFMEHGEWEISQRRAFRFWH